MHTFKNPIIPGFYPDPSITKKGKDFYLVCSTFNYFPGIPVFHSQDLVHWEQVGNVITRDAQAPLGQYQAYAATIRYRSRDDLFYVVTTLVKPGSYHENINVYYTATNPNGPWSDAHVIKGAEGIDPTLVFDGPDIWYLGNMRVEPENEKNTSRWIWLQKLDVQTGMLAGEKHILRKDGALYGAMCPEGPHIYQKGNWYYLLIAEGGTKHHHAVSVFRSKAITGPYEGDPRNPVLTHRNLSMDSPINSVGHADLIETEKGTWAVCLGVRPLEEPCTGIWEGKRSSFRSFGKMAGPSSPRRPAMSNWRISLRISPKRPTLPKQPSTISPRKRNWLRTGSFPTPSTSDPIDLKLAD